MGDEQVWRIRTVFCQIVLNKRDCGGSLGPRLARSWSQLHGRGYGPSPGHVVRTGHHPYDSPISGRLPWHARSIGRAPPLSSSRVPRSRRSSARGPRRLPRPPHVRVARRRGPARATRLPPRGAPRPPRCVLSSCFEQISHRNLSMNRTGIGQAMPDSGVASVTSRRCPRMVGLRPAAGPR